MDLLLYQRLFGRLLDQDYEKIRLIRSLKNFIFQYQDFVEIYSVSAETIIKAFLLYLDGDSSYGLITVPKIIR
jgi:hypothetical protein